MIIILIVFNIQNLSINENNTQINILIGNSFRNYYQLPKKSLYCKLRRILYTCKYISSKVKRYDAVIYNGNRNFPNKTEKRFNIIMTTEKLSQVRFMEQISKGKSKYYQLAIDYRLFNNRWHLSYPIYSYYNLKDFIKQAQINYGNISAFMIRKGIVYIQKVAIKNRHYIVKELMKYFPIDSYGRDLNNIKWPTNISTDNKIDILKKYKFCLAIENSVITWKRGLKYEAAEINNDYVTEKLTDCLIAGSIPIYFGPKTIDLFIPHPKSIINLSKYNSIDDVANYIINIINNSKYLELHMYWLKNYSKEWFNRFNYFYNFNYCKVCKKIIRKTY